MRGVQVTTPVGWRVDDGEHLFTAVLGAAPQRRQLGSGPQGRDQSSSSSELHHGIGFTGIEGLSELGRVFKVHLVT